MTIRTAMIQGIHKFDSGDNYPLTMQDLDWFAIRQWPSVINFTVGAGRRTAQELVAEGVLIRVKRGVYRVNKKRLARALKALGVGGLT